MLSDFKIFKFKKLKVLVKSIEMHDLLLIFIVGAYPESKIWLLGEKTRNWSSEVFGPQANVLCGRMLARIKLP